MNNFRRSVPVGFGIKADLEGNSSMSSSVGRPPAFNAMSAPINHIGIVVADVAATARQYTEIFGAGPWTFAEFVVEDVVLHGRPAPGTAKLRAATGMVGGLRIELLEPVDGPSVHAEFLDRHGPGIQHVSFGPAADYDGVISRVEALGVEVEMQGRIGQGAFTYFETQPEFGISVEMNPLPQPRTASRKAATRQSVETAAKGLIDTSRKRIMQVGIVVPDAGLAARRFGELFGTGPWSLIEFVPPHVENLTLHGMSVDESDFRVRGAIADHPDIQFELLEPVGGRSTHLEFLQQHGPGAHHLSFGSVPDHDDVIGALVSRGVSTEMSGLLGGSTAFTYVATQRELGTIFEFTKVTAGRRSTLTPSGTIPANR
jgi:catechol 2,3-dioxygenase-like lactoylglutathione lyase family enzyme